jgi:hypothetical protein
MIFGGRLNLPMHEIVDCGAFCEVIFFCISPKNQIGDFFYRLNEKGHREPVFIGDPVDRRVGQFLFSVLIPLPYALLTGYLHPLFSSPLQVNK